METLISTENESAKDTSSVLVALLPALLVAVYIFGFRALLLTFVCIASCMLAELVFRFFTKRPLGFQESSAAVTGTLISFALPADFPLWMAASGSIAGILMAKELFGGYGNNFLNPAAAGIAFLDVSFFQQMNQFPYPVLGASLSGELASSPIQLWLAGRVDEIPSTIELFLGFTSGGMGEVSALALLIGAIFLYYKKILSPATSLAFLGTVTGIAWIAGNGSPLFHLLSGGILLVAFFMVADPVTTPASPWGRVVFGVGCGVFAMLIRYTGSYVEGTVFAVLLMNILTPYIEKIPWPKALTTLETLWKGKGGTEHDHQ